MPVKRPTFYKAGDQLSARDLNRIWDVLERLDKLDVLPGSGLTLDDGPDGRVLGLSVRGEGFAVSPVGGIPIADSAVCPTVTYNGVSEGTGPDLRIHNRWDDTAVPPATKFYWRMVDGFPTAIGWEC